MKLSSKGILSTTNNNPSFLNENCFHFSFRYGITVAGRSTDGDPKCLSAMCYEIVNHGDGPINIQDPTHVTTKIRNRFVNKNLKLMMGTSRVTAEHLKTLIRNQHKSVHGLSMSDASPIDRQNFRSAERIMEERVILALRNVNGSEATIQYLKMCHNITSSFLDHHIKPLERVFRLFRSVYFIRIWRNFIKASRFQSLNQNFISHNAYLCIEINAKGLIELIKKFRSENAPYLFLPPIFDSQTCEKTFRQLRSMTTVNFTRINFSLYELLHMIRRTEVQNDIAYFKLTQNQVLFPLSHKRSQKTETHDLPSDIEINEILVKAKEAAIDDALAFGMNSDNIDGYEFQSHLNLTMDDDVLADLNDEEDDFIDENYEENADFTTEDEPVGMEVLDPNSIFTTVIDENGQEIELRKSTLIWMLTEPGVGLSKDRLRRVQVKKKQ